MISKMKTIGATAAFATAMMLGAHSASAATVALEDLGVCSADPSLNTATNNISIGDVTGNNGGATGCWGTVDGNDPGPDEGFTLGGTTYAFVSKDEEEGIEGENIGLEVTGAGASWNWDTSEGTWSFDSSLFGYGDFLIVLKAADSPGYAVWSFFGDPDNTSFSGTWSVAWTNDQGEARDLSHLSVYAAPAVIPLPAAGWLLLMGLGGLGIASRRKRKAQTA